MSRSVSVRDRASIWDQVGEIRARQGDYAGALRALQTAEQIRGLLDLRLYRR